ncbi:MAG: hypothetical protein ACR2PT_09365 [Endozoicomonas sp.]
MLKKFGVFLLIPWAAAYGAFCKNGNGSFVACSGWEKESIGQLDAVSLQALEIEVPPLQGKSLLGVSFSGGGSRSLSLVRGQLAALKLLGIDERVNYYSAVSGGAWASVVYHALQDDAQQKAFLGEPAEAGDLYLGEADEDQPANLSWLDPGSLGNVPGRVPDLPWSLAWVISGVWNSWQDTRQVWREILASVLLHPYGIDSSSPLTSGSLHFRRQDQQIIVNAALKDGQGRLYPFEMTPISMGVRARIGEVGGYMVAPENFGRRLISDKQGRLRLKSERSDFGLADMLAVTSANYAHFGGFFSSWPVVWGRNLMPPSWVVPRYWYPMYMESGEIVNRRFDLVDGGPLDYLGVMPLLGRGVKKLIVFVNTDTPLALRVGEESLVVGMEKAIAPLFGFLPDEEAARGKYHLMSGGCGDFCVMKHNQVFPSIAYVKLARGLWAARQSDGPVVYLQKGVEVLPNAFYGIDGQYKVDILWVYNELPGRWRKELSEELQATLTRDSRFSCRAEQCVNSGSRFPHFSAMFELHLDPVQVNMLFHKAAWEVKQSQGLFNQLLME